ncbi:glycosyltransferase [Yoonia sp.]|uniref:MraY family glycosyltransferase n=1 Tax=Yoonia sp. TaxID=2212373 RepID=UPI00358F3373
MIINFTLVMMTSVIVGLSIILLHRVLPRLTQLRDDLQATQRSHLVPTPRLGGIAVLASIITILFVQPTQAANWFTALCLSLIPVAATGLAEDLGLRVRPKWRLLAAALSSATAIAVLGVWIPRVDIVGLDFLMQSKVIALTFTVVATAGVCHSFNLIDGINGLAGSFAISALLGLSLIAGHAENTGTPEIGFLLIGAVLGFLLLNFPFGKIFLGDAGAYSLGHIVVWYAIYLVWTMDDLTAWSIGLILFWPIMDTLYAMYRRSMTGKPMDHPDRLHFHQVVMRVIQISSSGRIKMCVANPLATIIIVPFFAGPIIFGTLLWDQPLMASLTLCGFAAGFVLTYQALISFASLRPRSRVTRNYDSVPRQSI